MTASRVQTSLPVFIMKGFSLRYLLLMVASLAVSLSAHAQMIPQESIESIDSKVLTSQTVVVGTVTDFEADPKGDDYGQRNVTFSVKETLKGEAATPFTVRMREANGRLEEWKANSVRLLIYVPTRQDAWVVANVTDLGDKNLLESSANFKVIRDPDKLLKYIRELVRKNPGVENIATLRIEPPKNDTGAAWLGYTKRSRAGLVVPADQRLEAWAREMMRSKKKEDRREGLRAIALFKSDQNIRLVKELLKDPSFDVAYRSDSRLGIEDRQYSIRSLAFDVLQRWGIIIEKVLLTESVSKIDSIETLDWRNIVTLEELQDLKNARKLTSLSLLNYPLTGEQLAAVGELENLTTLRLAPMSVSDSNIKSLLKLKNLQSLSLDGNPISDVGAMLLAQLPKLKDVSLSETEVTNEGLNALRQAKPGLRVTPVKSVSAIHQFLQRKDFDGVRRILDLLPDAVNQKDPHGYSPLHVASMGERTDIVQFLLDRGAKVDALNDAQETPLLKATMVNSGDSAVMRALITVGANLNLGDKNGTTPLHMAVANPEVRYHALRLLLACGADPLAKDKGGRTQLDLVAKGGSGRMVSDLIAAKQTQIKLIPQTSANCNQTVYRLNRADVLLAEWSSVNLGPLVGTITWTQALANRNFIGPFGQQAVTLKLENLKQHKNVEVELELFIIGSWDGNGGLGRGPDIIDIQIPGVGTALHSTFFNCNEGNASGLPMQSFPDPYPFAFHKGYHQAAEAHNLRFTDLGGDNAVTRNAIYKLKYTFAHGSKELKFIISGLTVPQGGIQRLADDERWGIGSISDWPMTSAGESAPSWLRPTSPAFPGSMESK